MTTQLQTITERTKGLSPAQAMLALGQLHKQVMDARGKAYTQGLTAIHNAYCALDKEVEQAQATLLSAHPELMGLAL